MKAGGSCGGTSVPVIPCATTSAVPMTSVATTGAAGVHRLERGQGHPLLAGRQHEHVRGVQEHAGVGPMAGQAEELGHSELGRLAGR